MNTNTHQRQLRAVDLFCGAGGLSTGLAVACEQLETDIDLVAVNHWDRAVETHQRNHPWADHYQSTIQEVDPDDVFDDDDPVDILVGGPECTHFSSARGGKPVKDQKRMPAWHVLTWIQKLQPQTFVLENVPEFRDWGPIEDGQPTRNGEVFDSWVTALENHGYFVDYRVLNAADHGDATSRKRLFVLGHREHPPTFPQPTHSEDGTIEGTEPWRSAKEVLDWTDHGQSIWTRGVDNGKRPLVENTMDRIAEGLRRHGGDAVAPFADVVAGMTQDQVSQMQTVAVPIEEAEAMCELTDDPFLVTYDDETTVICPPFLLRQQSGGVPPATTDPLPTISTKGAIAKVEPFLIQYYGQSGSRALSEPLPTVTTKGRFALVHPEAFPYGLDLRYRMLQPSELASAMGFPESYEFAGNKTETIKQIGNAVPVNLGASLCHAVLTTDDELTPLATPSATQFAAHEDD